MKTLPIKLLILLSLNFNLFSQVIKLSKTQAIQDIDTLHKYIEEIHPNAYAYKSKKSIDSLYDRVKSKITDSISIYTFYNYASLLTANYGDGHLSTLFPQNWYSEKHIVVPFTIDIIDQKVYIQKFNKNTGLSKNSEIIEINDAPIKSIIDTMLLTRSGESYNFRKERLKEDFSQLLFSINGFDNKYKVKIKQENIEKTCILDGIDYKTYRKIAAGSERKIPDYSITYNKKNNTCILDFREFNDLQKFKIFLDTTFSSIKKQQIKNLIIDLRNNSGGNSELGDELLQYIAKNDFTQYDKTLMKVSPHLKKLWATYFLPKGYIDSSMLQKVMKIPDGVIVQTDTVFEEETELKKIKEQSIRFDGNVYLLTNNYTFSSAADFAWCFKHYKMGKIIGEETGGWGLCYGDNVYAELPNSNLAIDVSCKLFYNIGATESSTHGVIPDYPVKADDAIDFVIKMITKEP